MATTTGVIFTLILANVMAQVKIEGINPEGVLFEKVSDVLIHHNIWRIFAKLEIMDEEKVLEHIEQAINHTEKVCDRYQQMEKETECEYWKKEIEQKTEALKTKLQGLQIFLKTNRPRRALVNAVGKLSKYLFGTMDADDAENIENEIKTIDSTNKQTLHLMEKQISITTTNFKTLENEIGNVTAVQEEFEKRLAIIEKQAQHFHDLVGNVMLNRLMLQITAKIDKLQQNLNEQYEIITALKLHILHPLLLSPEELQTIYLEINKYEKSHQIAPDNQITNQLIRVNTEVIENEVWIQIRVPLLEPEAYSLYHAYEIPTTEGKTPTYILDLETPYLLNNSRTQSYIELTQQNLEKQCQTCQSKAGKEILACKIPQARVTGASSTNCLINLFNKEEREKRSCKHKIMEKTDDMLIKLHKENAWMYVISNAQDVRAQCGNDLQRFKIKGAGIMTLTQECHYTISAFELPFTKNINTSVEVHQTKKEDLPIPPSNLENLAIQAEVKTISTGHLKVTQHSEFHQSMKKGVKDLNDLIKDINTVRNTPLVTKIQNHTNSLAILVILIIITIIGIYKCRTKKIKSKNPKDQQAPEVLILQTNSKDTSVTHQLAQQTLQIEKPKTLVPQPPTKETRRALKI